MKEFFLDLALPATDRAVAIQWIVMGIVWVAALVSVRRKERDIQHFVLGLVVINLAWFSVRAVH